MERITRADPSATALSLLSSASSYRNLPFVACLLNPSSLVPPPPPPSTALKLVGPLIALREQEGGREGEKFIDNQIDD